MFKWDLKLVMTKNKQFLVFLAVNHIMDFSTKCLLSSEYNSFDLTRYFNTVIVKQATFFLNLPVSLIFWNAHSFRHLGTAQLKRFHYTHTKTWAGIAKSV